MEKSIKNPNGRILKLPKVVQKTTIILTLTDNKLFEVNGPLDNPADRRLMIEMLEKAIDVCKNYKGGLIQIADGARYTELDHTKVNHLAKIKV